MSAAQDFSAADEVDPVADLGLAWNTEIDFGLADPARYSVPYVPDRQAQVTGAIRSVKVFRSQIGETGALCTLVMAPPAERALDPGDRMYQALAQAIPTDGPNTPIDVITVTVVSCDRPRRNVVNP
ncbi:MAG: TetR family transcription regulator [Pseudonocardiales bacterium]|nr:TetR family transcription regulator [Pseudonocardiales bacterium]